MLTDTTLIITKIHQAERDGYAGLSTDEALLAALVLDRPDWLDAMKFTLAEAIDRIGPDWAAAIPQLARALDEERARRNARYSYRIDPLPDESGGGYQLWLVDGDHTVNGGTFPVHGQAASYQCADFAYSEAVAAAFAWLDSHQ